MDWLGALHQIIPFAFPAFSGKPLLDLGIGNSGAQFVQSADCQIWNRLSNIKGRIVHAHPGKGIKMKRWAVIFVTLISMPVVLVPMAQAADEHAGRIVQHTQKVETKEVGDIPGHITGVAESYGLIFFSKGPAIGEIATTMATTHFDLVNGKGTFTAERVETYQDGSTRSIKIIGTQTPVDGGKGTAFEGTYEFTGGTGRFEGTEGKGTSKGERLGSPKTGGDTYLDFTGTEWKRK